MRHDRVEVVVDGIRWRRVATLAEARPDDKVFVLDPEAGTIVFGDGVHGRVPDEGSSIELGLRYGAGGGSYQLQVPQGSVVRISARRGCLPAAVVLLAGGVAAVGLVGRRADRP
jgi:hypothetical protein